MYYPYFRGKQYELITIREKAELLAEHEFVPVIEPVKESLNGLRRSLNAVSENQGSALVIVNPSEGDYREDRTTINNFLVEEYSTTDGIYPAVLLRDTESLNSVTSLIESASHKPVALIHAGFDEGRELSTRLGNFNLHKHIFLDEYVGRLYRRHFRYLERVLIRDGFERRTNRDHPDTEFFSDLHITYAEEGVSGFGDYLITGDEYSETGGPAWAVAIHLTFIDASRDGEMHIHHFKSDRHDSPTDTPGKFLEALEKLVREADSNDTMLYQTRAIEEFRGLYARRHFPGLGYVKKLSMQHHIETLAEFLRDQ